MSNVRRGYACDFTRTRLPEEEDYFLISRQHLAALENLQANPTPCNEALARILGAGFRKRSMPKNYLAWLKGR